MYFTWYLISRGHLYAFYVVSADLWGYLCAFFMVSVHLCVNMNTFLYGLRIPVPGTSWVSPGCSWVHSGCPPVPFVRIVTFSWKKCYPMPRRVGGTLEQVPPCLLGISRQFECMSFMCILDICLVEYT